MDQEELKRLAVEFSIDKKLVEILVERGFDTQKKLSDFLYPSLDNLTDAHKYVGYDDVLERIRFAIANNEKILIYGDYDCDGVCGVSILHNYLKSVGVDVNCFLPNRHTDGYGLSIETLEKLAEEYLSDLIITVDCGITAVEEVEYAREALGFDVIITDHHEPGEVLPDCLIFNPKLSGEDCFRELCGAGVALRIVEGLGGDEERNKYLDIASIATIADIVPLVGDNRIIAKSGLKVINSFNCAKGIKKLVKKCMQSDVVSSYDISYKISPRINSLGRMGDANAVLDLFCTQDNFLLDSIVNELDESNAKRMQLTQDLTEHCFEMLKGYDFEHKPVIVLHSAYWEDGIIGIVASKVVEAFKRPAILLTKSGDIYKGSGRSVKGIDIRKYVAMCEDMLVKYGGHKMACGLSIEEKNINDFAAKINNLVAGDFDMGYFMPSERYDVDMSEVESALDMARGLQLLEPFGEGNPKIKFKECINSLEFTQMGSTAHLVSRRADREILMFSGLKYKELLESNVPKELYLDLKLAEFKNKLFAQSKIYSFICADVEEQGDYGAYLMTGLAVGDYDVDVIDYQRALELGGDRYSTCYIAYDFDTYRTFSRQYCEKYGCILTQNKVSNFVVPVTKIIFCPTSLKELGYYKNVVLLDKPLSVKMFGKFLSGKGKLYCLNNDGILAKVKQLLPSYKRLGEIYLAIKAVVDKKDIRGMAELYYTLNKSIGVQYDEVVLSAVVLAELGILKLSGRFSIDNSVKRKLDESKIYNAICNA